MSRPQRHPRCAPRPQASAVAQSPSQRHPVASAMARAGLDAAVREFLIRLYLIPEGEPIETDAVAAWKAMAVAVRVLDLQGQLHSPESRVMQGAMRAVEQMAERQWRWRRLDATALDAGLMRAAAVVKAAPSAQVHQAWLYVLNLLGGGSRQAQTATASQPQPAAA